MKFQSTRGAPGVSLDDALLAGLAADGGLFVPDTLPRIDAGALAGDDIRATGRAVLAPFFDGSRLAGSLDEIVDETFSFPIPCVALRDDAQAPRLLELFHGPTAAFKDVGAGFLAACLSRLDDGASPLTILVATSGDTGGAVAAAFDGRPGIRVAVLFPHGRVSARQEKQLTCWGENVLSLSVSGAFDDCQALVKAAFAERALRERFRFSSANSINIGRLLPQSIYYAHAALEHERETGRKPSFVIPTGNLGNALACVLARDMGLPVGDIVLSLNENRLIADYLAGGEWAPRPSLHTHASAMDVGNPSNMERLRALHGDADELREQVSACVVTDEEIKAEIRRSHREFGRALCPHTATAVHAWRQLPAARRAGSDWILVATAHAAKFESVVEPLIGAAVPLPPELERILSRPSRAVRIEADLDELARALAAAWPVDGRGGRGLE